MERHAYIDALRGYAILGVVVVHASQQFPGLDGSVKSIAGQGARGVQLFFVVSALTLMLSWHSRNDGATRFLIRRFFRIAPMFWLAIVFFLILDGFAPRYWAPSGIGWEHVLATATFVHGWHPETITSVVPGGWSIAVEMTFYLMFPLLVLAIRSSWSAALALIVGIVLARNLNPIAPSLWPGEEPYIENAFAFFWFPNQLPTFLVGILVFYLSRDLRGRLPALVPEIGLVLSIGLILLITILPIPRLQSLLSYSLLFGSTALCLTQGAGSWLLLRPVRALGTVSYSGYLWHFAILGVLAALYHRAGFNPFGIDDPSCGWPYFLLFFAVLLAMTAALSALTYRYIETRGIELGRNLASRFANSRRRSAFFQH
jgi:peptidoglycan/LPS O-acetylase OafA/YrhL